MEAAVVVETGVEVAVEAAAVVEVVMGADLRCARRGRLRRARRCYTRTARKAARPNVPSSPQPVRPPCSPEAPPACSGLPAGPERHARAACVPRGTLWLALWCLPKVIDSAASDRCSHGSAELLRTYGFLEPSPHTRVAISLDELLDTATRLRAVRGRGGRSGRAPLPAPRARHRAAALERAGLLPAGGVFLVGAATEVEPGLLTAVQVQAGCMGVGGACTTLGALALRPLTHRAAAQAEPRLSPG